MKSKYLLLIVLAFASYSCATNHNDNETLFTHLSAEETGIYFQNTIKEGPNTNVLMYEYFYNGAGVALADFNGDGLLDIYASSNMGENKMYLNKGDFQFEDITRISKTSGRSGPWKTGITAVDINGDQRMDLYVCYSGMVKDAQRKNQLFLNLGNNEEGTPIFAEAAGLFGLDSSAYSNQGYFFDYDKDGDLDMLLLNHNPKSMPILGVEKTKSLLKKDAPLTGLRLYEQRDNYFYDITPNTKINGSSLSYGLSIAIADYNNDGWSDFYVCNDYTIPDYLYINDQHGGFDDQLKKSINHTSHFSMGNDSGDMNNDGWTDLFTLDMLPEDNERQKKLRAPDNYNLFDINLKNGFHHQYMRNMLQKNNGDGTFSEIGQMAGVSNTDWSWSALFADFDSDGWQDLFVSNGYLRDYTNRDFLKYMEDYVSEKKSNLKRDDVLEIINQMPSSNVSNYVFKNQKGGKFLNSTESWGLKEFSNSSGAAYGDLDNDGDLDLVVNKINDLLGVYMNNSSNNNNTLTVSLESKSKNSLGIGAKVTLYANGILQTREQNITRGYLSSISPLIHFGLQKETKIDSIVVDWPLGKREVRKNISANQLLVFNEKDSKPHQQTINIRNQLLSKVPSTLNSIHRIKNTLDFDRQPLLHFQPSHEGPVLTKGDINNDQLEDLVVGGSQGQPIEIWVQQSDGSFKKKDNQEFQDNSKATVTSLALLDFDQDGNLDLYVGHGGYHQYSSTSEQLYDQMYLNDGTGNFKALTLSILNQSSTTVVAKVNDINEDGFPDIFVGGGIVPGEYPLHYKNRILINNQGQWTENNEWNKILNQQDGIVRDAIWEDVNGDNQKDLILVGEWMQISVYLVKSDSLVLDENFFNNSLTSNGWWNTIKGADINKDGKPDFIIGNEGVNNPFNASAEHPIELHYDDFDNNGTIDPILSYFIESTSYPFATRDELLSQLVMLKSHYPSYDSYSKADLNEVLSYFQKDQMKTFKTTQLKSILLLSTEDGYKARNLPDEAQSSPIKSIMIEDLNGDTHQDIILLGNRTKVALKLGRNDSNPGVILLGDSKGNFTVVSFPETGLKLNKNISGIEKIKDQLYISQTNDSLLTYKIN